MQSKNNANGYQEKIEAFKQVYRKNRSGKIKEEETVGGFIKKLNGLKYQENFSQWKNQRKKNS